MNPDMVAGAALVAVGVAAWAVNTVACRWVLSRDRSLEALAVAVGVLTELPTRGLAERTTPTDSRTRVGGFGSAGGSGSNDRPGALVPTLDHTPCEGGCGRIVCCCLPLHTPRCTGTSEQACGHLTPLCEACCGAFCFECLTERLSDVGWYGGAR